MSENYDVYVKRFSHDWWENFWMYYKWYVIGGIALVFCLAWFLTECVFHVNNDFTMTYMGDLSYMGFEQQYALEDKLALDAHDIDGNGKIKTKVNVIYLDAISSSEEMGNNYNAADIEMAGGDTVVYLFSKAQVDRYSKYGFYDISAMTSKYNIDEKHLLRYDDGRVYAVELSDNLYFNSIEGLKTEGLYLVVRPLRESDKSQRLQDLHADGLLMADFLIGGGVNSQQ